MGRGSVCPRVEREGWERETLSPFATKSTDARAIARQYPCSPDDFRTEYERDYTRIIHSRAFRRLRHKTQVFISPENDHLCTRLEHSLHVASVAGTIAGALRLNRDLVNAIAVGHDLGHAPFGHKGEVCIRKFTARYHLKRFHHEFHSLRVVDELESPYRQTQGHPGLNLTFAVRDAIACHWGEGFEKELMPSKRSFAGLRRLRRGPSRPATLEGCVVRWADKVAYIGRDLEDAYMVDLLKPADVPRNVRRVLGTSNRDIIARLVSDLVKCSRDSGCIAVSPRVHEALNELYEFSNRRIYRTPVVEAYFEQVDKAMEIMLQEMMSLVKKARENNDQNLFPNRKETCLRVLAEFLTRDVLSWREQKPAQLVVDFVAGMTDSFFTSAFAELFLPGSLV